MGVHVAVGVLVGVNVAVGGMGVAVAVGGTGVVVGGCPPAGQYQTRSTGRALAPRPPLPQPLSHVMTWTWEPLRGPSMRKLMKSVVARHSCSMRISSGLKVRMFLRRRPKSGGFMVGASVSMTVAALRAWKSMPTNRVLMALSSQRTFQSPGVVVDRKSVDWPVSSSCALVIVASRGMSRRGNWMPPMYTWL